MKSLLVLLASLCAAVAIFIGGVAVAAYFISDPEPHMFANMDTPDLWTSQPVVVDTASQDYERIAALPTIASVPASLAAIGNFSQREDEGKADAGTVTGADDTQNTQIGIDQASTGSVSPDVAVADDGAAVPLSFDPQHADWCFARYRSYRLEDDSYQPFGSGPRQQCLSPWTTTPDGMAASAGDAQGVIGGEGSSSQGEEATVDQVGYSSAEGQHAAMPASGVAPAGAHEEWCFARYRSYRVSDNSYQPLNGVARRACSSPYG